MRRALVLFMLFSLVAIANAEFIIESIRVTVSNIQPDGSASVREDIKFMVKGSFSKALYDSGFRTSGDLSIWTSNTGLKDVRQHVNPAVVVIDNFALQPQPRTGCNPFLDMCHGGIMMTYNVRPAYNNTQPVDGTGMFAIVDYKPRTTKYMLNPAALSFTPTEDEGILLEPNVVLSIVLPHGSRIMDVSPAATSTTSSADGTTLSWTDLVLVRPSVVFEVEQSIDKEVTTFFSSALKNFQTMVKSPHGIAFLILVALLVGSCVYISIAKKKKEE